MVLVTGECCILIHGYLNFIVYITIIHTALKCSAYCLEDIVYIDMIQDGNLFYCMSACLWKAKYFPKKCLVMIILF